MVSLNPDVANQCGGPQSFYIIDDHPVICLGLSQLINSQPGWRVVGTNDSIDSGFRQVVQLRPTVVIVDLLFPGMSGLSQLITLREVASWSVRVVYSVQPVNLYAWACLQAGATAYLHKSASKQTTLAGIQSAIAGRLWVGENVWQGTPQSISRSLTQRELEVFQMIGQGRSTREIAAALCRSVKTIETHRQHLLRKLGARCSSDLVRLAVQSCEEAVAKGN